MNLSLRMFGRGYRSGFIAASEDESQGKGKKYLLLY